MIAENAIECLLLRRQSPAAELVLTFIPAETVVAHALTSLPSTSTMQVSQVCMGPSCG